jgi:hypothetical protein
VGAQDEDVGNEACTEENVELKQSVADENLCNPSNYGPYCDRREEGHHFVQAFNAKQLDRKLE